MDSGKSVIDKAMMDEFVAQYVGAKDKSLELKFREQLGVSSP